MNEFKGFPVKMQFTPVPNLVFSSLLPQITDINELKLLLHIFAILYVKKGNLKFITLNEIQYYGGLSSDLKNLPVETLDAALADLVKKGILLELKTVRENRTQSLFFVNTEANRLNIENISSGELVLPQINIEAVLPVSQAQPADVFTLYEENIGMLTPLIADELKEAVKQYPENWIQEAVKEAVAQNKRNWRYISRILERWSIEGKNNGAHRGHSKANTDPDKYVKGKYGHLVQR
jgi:DNA replication protein